MAQSDLGHPDHVETAAPAAEAAPDAETRKPVSRPAARPAPAPQRAAVKPEATKPEIAKAETSTANDFSPAERIAIQNALSWSGDYGGAADGDDAMTTAIKTFQKRTGAKVTGTLNADERARLIAAGKSREAEFGWAVVDDTATGARIGLPTRMVPNRRETRDGTRWSSKHGDIQVESFRLRNGLSLAALFELEKTHPKTRRVEYSVLRGDSFYMSGLQGLRKFAVRATAKDGEVRGFTVQFDQALETIVAPVAAAMASTFTPFPAGGMALASAPSSKVAYGSAVIVSADGHLLTERRLTDGCQVLIAAGLGPAERRAANGDLALLRVYGQRHLAPAPLGGDSDGEITLLGVPEPRAQDNNRAGGNAVRAATTSLSASGPVLRMQSPPGGGYAGAGAFDRTGRLAGLVTMRDTLVASTDAVAPQASVIPAERLAEFLAAHHVAAHEVAAAGVTTDAPAVRASPDAAASVVRVICVRK